MKNDHLVVDSSVFISSFSPEDSFHKTSLSFFSEIRNKEIQIILPFIGVFEILHALHRYNLKGDFEKKLIAIWNNPVLFYLVNHDEYFLKEIFLPNYQKIKLKASDALFVVTALFYRAPLISWDRKLLRQAKVHISAITPKNFLDKIS